MNHQKYDSLSYKKNSMSAGRNKKHQVRNALSILPKLPNYGEDTLIFILRGVSWFDVCLFILKNIRICCKLEIQVSMANEQG